MPGSPSPNKGYIIPTVFGDLNIWGNELNSNFATIDLNMGGTLAVALSGTTATVSGSNTQYGGYTFTGSLAATNVVSFSAYAGFAFFYNNTAGSQNISCGIAGGTYINVTPGESIIAWSDGTNFYRTAIVGGGGSTTGSGAVVLASGATVTNMNGVIPAGTITQYAGNTAPNSQWLFCDGTAYSRTTYAALFAACSTAYGAGNGTSTFNVPDMRGRTGVGFDSGNATGRMTNAAGFGISAAAVGNNGGEQYHTLSVAELAVHAHGVADPTHAHGVADPTHAHGVADPSHVHGVGDPGHAHGVADPSHSHGLDGNIYTNEPNGGNFFPPTGGNWANPISQNGPGANTYGAGTGIGIYGSGTGVYLGYSGTGIGIYGAYTGIGIYGAYTGISIGAAGSNFGHNNTQPGLITGYIIKT